MDVESSILRFVTIIIACVRPPPTLKERKEKRKGQLVVRHRRLSSLFWLSGGGGCRQVTIITDHQNSFSDCSQHRDTRIIMPSSCVNVRKE